MSSFPNVCQFGCHHPAVGIPAPRSGKAAPKRLAQRSLFYMRRTSQPPCSHPASFARLSSRTSALRLVKWVTSWPQALLPLPIFHVKLTYFEVSCVSCNDRIAPLGVRSWRGEEAEGGEVSLSSRGPSAAQNMFPNRVRSVTSPSICSEFHLW